MRVQLLAFDGVFDTGLAVLTDAFSTANELAVLQGLDSVRFEVHVAGVRRRIRSAHGLTVPARRIEDDVDWTIVPAIGAKMPAPLLAALARADVREGARVLKRFADRGHRLAAACIGTFVLAESGALDGQTVTTTWWLAPLFRQRYPQVRVDQTRMVIPSGRVVTAGAALSHMDLALWIIRQESPSLAALTARYLVVDPRPSQSAFALTGHQVHSDPLVARFEQWVRSHLEDGFSLDAAAAAVATSKRTLARRLQEVLGRTPLAYVQDLRIERAMHLLRTTDQTVEDIAAQVGYSEGTTLKALLRQRLGKGLREIRQN